MALPKTIRGIYNWLSKGYFLKAFPDHSLPEAEDVEFRFVENGSEGEYIDTRGDLAGVLEVGEGKWLMEINRQVATPNTLLIPVVAHEMVHMVTGSPDHKSKAWKSGVRKLQGTGFFLRIF